MIVDTSVLFAILFREPERNQLIGKLTAQTGNLSMSVATQVEAHVVAQRAGVANLERDLAALIKDYGIRIVPLSTEAGQIAIEAHRNFGKGSGHRARLNFGDCFSYALAKEMAEPLLYKGRDFGATDLVPMD
jgi:ribonuclease VapC